MILNVKLFNFLISRSHFTVFEIFLESFGPFQTLKKFWLIIWEQHQKIKKSMSKLPCLDNFEWWKFNNSLLKFYVSVGAGLSFKTNKEGHDW